MSRVTLTSLKKLAIGRIQPVGSIYFLSPTLYLISHHRKLSQGYALGKLLHFKFHICKTCLDFIKAVAIKLTKL